MQAREHSVDVGGMTIRYRDSGGDGATLVFVHGVYVTGQLWSPLTAHLDGFRCMTPTWPLGAHPDPVPGADLSARRVAESIPAFLDALALDDVTLVGNDTGGGLCLAALASDHPGTGRIGRLVLTNCDSYEHFPPKGFDAMVNTVRRVPPLGRLIIRSLASRVGRRLFLRAVCHGSTSDVDADAVFGAFATSSAARADALRFTASMEPSVTLESAHAIGEFDRPVLVAWGTEDKLFPVDHARRLTDDFPHATLQLIDDASTYVMLDRPAELAKAITAFMQDG